jgi:hypothetical protein
MQKWNVLLRMLLLTSCIVGSSVWGMSNALGDSGDNNIYKTPEELINPPEEPWSWNSDFYRESEFFAHMPKYKFNYYQLTMPSQQAPERLAWEIETLWYCNTLKKKPDVTVEKYLMVLRQTYDQLHGVLDEIERGHKDFVGFVGAHDMTDDMPVYHGKRWSTILLRTSTVDVLCGLAKQCPAALMRSLGRGVVLDRIMRDIFLKPVQESLLKEYEKSEHFLAKTICQCIKYQQKYNNSRNKQ